ncbi:MAG: adenylate/guanylate cyclase domain-containing protein [Chloroflexi bacterium]|nr:MAG: adenylate/guanylate cyclase domain-containing protein [Chloroflexota bacterium]
MGADWSDLVALNEPPELVKKLAVFVAQAEEWVLYELNPRYLAEQLAIGEREALRLLVTAVAAHKFDLGWRVICPVCQGMSPALNSLSQLHYQNECVVCSNRFITHLDDEVVVVFTVRPEIRPLSEAARANKVARQAIDERLGRVPALALLNLPRFHQLIHDQLLPEGQSLGVRQMAIFFSDLRQSTAFYHKFGDAVAYRWVCEHFAILFEAVAAHGGTAVKTIGDGVMGTFTDEMAALQSIVTGMKGIVALNQQAGLKGSDRLTLKVGLHVGQCIVVTLNGRLDYFGETVNIAARLGGLATGNDIILSQAVLSRPGNRAQAETLGELMPISARLKGLPGHFDLYRLLVK